MRAYAPKAKVRAGWVRYEISESHDLFEGESVALVDCGAAKPSWFARVGCSWHNTPRKERSWRMEGGRVYIRERTNGLFMVNVKCSPDEYRDRWAERNLFAAGDLRAPGVGASPPARAIEAAKSDSAFQAMLRWVVASGGGFCARRYYSS